MKPERCRGCPLEDAPGPVWGNGAKDARMVLIGEAPGHEEVTSGVGFVGPAGRVLGVVCRVAGVDQGACWVTNAVKCLPPKRGKTHAPTTAEIEFCGVAWLRDELLGLDEATVVVAIGAVAFQAVTGKRREVTQWRGAILEEGE